MIIHEQEKELKDVKRQLERTKQYVNVYEKIIRGE